MTAQRQTTPSTDTDTARIFADLDRVKADPAFTRFAAQLRYAPGPSFGINVGAQGNDTLTGQQHDNIFFSLDGNDQLTGGPGRNLMVGGRGDDLYIPHSAADTILEYQDEGHDVVSAGFDYALPDHVEVLQMNGDQARVGIGNAQDNLINSAGASSVLINGRDGDDTLFTTGGTKQAMLIGGRGHDLMFALPEVAIVAANRGDGTEHLILDGVRELTIALGKGITPGDLSLHKEGKSLILSTGAGEQIELADYYDATTPAPRRVVLQMAMQANDLYDAASADLMHNRRFVQFDLDQLARQSERQQQQQPSGAIAPYALAAALPAAQLTGEEMVIGGALASTYATDGNLSALAPEARRSALDQMDWQARPAQAGSLPSGMRQLSDLFNQQQAAYPESAVWANLAGGGSNDATTTGNGNYTLIPRLNSSATTSSLNVSIAQLTATSQLATPR